MSSESEPLFAGEPIVLEPEILSNIDNDEIVDYASSVEADEPSGVTWQDRVAVMIYPYVFWIMIALGFLFTVPSYSYQHFKVRLESFVLYSRVTPALIRKDVSKLPKVPRHVAAVLNLKPVNVAGGGIEGLLYDVGEVSTWCVGAGPVELTIYERSGVLKNMPLSDVYRAITVSFERYFGEINCPTVHLQVPRTKQSMGASASSATLCVNLLSYADGRPLFLELTRELATEAIQSQLAPTDIDVDLIESRLRGLVGTEPDLLLMFTPTIDFQGFPPWHLRLCEIAYLPGNDSTSYMVFISALKKFANVKINIGK